jgi:uncharacterized protein HemY
MDNVRVLFPAHLRDLSDEYFSLLKEIKAAEMTVELKSAWSNMPDKTQYERSLYALICQAERGLFAMRTELKQVEQNIMREMSKFEKAKASSVEIFSNLKGI